MSKVNQIRVCMNWGGSPGNNDNLSVKVFEYNDDGELVPVGPTRLRVMLAQEAVMAELSFGDGQETVAVPLADLLGNNEVMNAHYKSVTESGKEAG